MLNPDNKLLRPEARRKQAWLGNRVLMKQLKCSRYLTDTLGILAAFAVLVVSEALLIFLRAGMRAIKTEAVQKVSASIISRSYVACSHVTSHAFVFICSPHLFLSALGWPRRSPSDQNIGIALSCFVHHPLLPGETKFNFGPLARDANRAITR